MTSKARLFLLLHLAGRSDAAACASTLLGRRAVRRRLRVMRLPVRRWWHVAMQNPPGQGKKFWHEFFAAEDAYFAELDHEFGPDGPSHDPEAQEKMVAYLDGRAETWT